MDHGGPRSISLARFARRGPLCGLQRDSLMQRAAKRSNSGQPLASGSCWTTECPTMLWRFSDDRVRLARTPSPFLRACWPPNSRRTRFSSRHRRSHAFACRSAGF